MTLKEEVKGRREKLNKVWLKTAGQKYIETMKKRIRKWMERYWYNIQYIENYLNTLYK